MKKLYIALSLFLASFAYSQVPQAFTYQTIAFNSAGIPIANGNVNLRISILDNSATGTVLYTETHTKTTNSKGLINLNIGQGTATTGNFGGINWGTNSKFVKVELDPAGGSNYTNVGVNQLMSVPYALVAGNLSNVSSNNTVTLKNNNGNDCIVVYSDTEAKGYYLNDESGGNPAYWSTTNVSFSSPIKGSIASNNTIVVYSDTEAKGYYLNKTSGGNPAYWSTTNVTFSSPVKGAIASNNTIVVYSDTEAKGYYLNKTSGGNPAYWSTTNVTFSSPIKGAIASKNTIVIYSDIEAKGYYLNDTSGGNPAYWSTTNVTFSSPIKGGFASGNTIVVYSDTEAKGYYLNSKSGGNPAYWSSTNAAFSSPVKGGISTAQ